jgi:hypothetical protein
MALIPANRWCSFISSTTRLQQATLDRLATEAAALQAGVNRGNNAEMSYLVRNPLDFREFGPGVMKDVARAGGFPGGAAVPGRAGGTLAPPVLPGGPTPGSGTGPDWASRFITGDGGRFFAWPEEQQETYGTPGSAGTCRDPGDCSGIVCSDDSQPLDMVSPEERGAPAASPPGQPVTIPPQPVAIVRASGAFAGGPQGMGEWTPTVARPGAVPSECLSGAAGDSGINPLWWLLLAGLIGLALAGGDEQTRTKRRTRKAAA